MEIGNFDELGEVERIAMLYAPQSLRPRFYALLLLDGQLSRIALTAREPALAQLRLAWWRDACADLPAARGQPLVLKLVTAWAGDAECLAKLIDAWEMMAVREGEMLIAAELVAEARASALAAAAGLAPDRDSREAARRWTLATLAARAPDLGQRDAMLRAAREIGSVRLPRSLRPLALLDGLARRALRRDGGGPLLGDRWSPLAAMRLGIFGR